MKHFLIKSVTTYCLFNFSAPALAASTVEREDVSAMGAIVGARTYHEGRISSGGNVTMHGTEAVKIGDGASIEGKDIRIAGRTVDNAGSITGKNICVNTEYFTNTGSLTGEHIVFNKAGASAVSGGK